jgi:hypothetical protein
VLNVLPMFRSDQIAERLGSPKQTAEDFCDLSLLKIEATATAALSQRSLSFNLQPPRVARICVGRKSKAWHRPEGDCVTLRC